MGNKQLIILEFIKTNETQVAATR